ncbi:DUF4180 domain-containing protein [Chondrinema litorale]|uniref:DUF4180 domain-containing protein n=1 Tax=Chondrinema litorale TaxID=2994555 RepID=UPI002543EF06|nr:DUF4180 domain-containing protein [Chondrinema litorale]UZR97524.1 DUF4180 domain-containing protein [Chondrinema litorale]
MNIKYIETDTDKIGVLEGNDYKINGPQEAAELLMNCQYSGTNKVIILAEQLDAAFFDLKTRIAGEILQKFSTYDGFLAIVGDFSKFSSKSLQDFIYESNKFKRINFVSSQEEAIKALSE